MVGVGAHLAHGLTIAAAAGLFAVGGYYLDRWLGTSPLFLLCGTLVGAAAGLLNLYWRLVVEPRQRDKGESGRWGGNT